MKRAFFCVCIAFLLCGCTNIPKSSAPPQITPTQTSVNETASSPTADAFPAELYLIREAYGRTAFTGVIDSEGNLVIPFEYASIEIISPTRLRLGKYIKQSPENKRIHLMALATNDGTPLCEFKYNYMDVLDENLIIGVSYDEANVHSDLISLDTGRILLSFESHIGAAHIADALAVQDNEQGNVTFYEYDKLLMGEAVERAKLLDTWMNYTVSEDLIVVQSMQKSYLADSTGALRFGPYEGLDEGCSEGLCSVMVGSKWGYIDRSGSFVIPPQYDYAMTFHEGCAIVMDNSKTSTGAYALIDKTGKTLVDQCFNINRFGKNELYTTVTRLNDHYESITYSLDKQGNLREIGPYDVWDSAFKGVVVVSANDEKTNVGLIDLASGDWLVNMGKYNSIFRTYNYYAADRVSDFMYIGQYQYKGRWLYDIMDARGNVVLSELNNVDYADSMRAIVQKGFSYGMMDMHGNWMYKQTIFTRPSTD